MRRSRVLLILPFACTWLQAQQSESESAPAPAAEQPPQERQQRSPREPQSEAPESVFDSDMVRALAWRNLGPDNPMGRVTDIEVPRQRQSTWFVGTGGGGVWRTKNAGTTWQPLFDHAGTVSIGDIAVAPNNPDIVWVGTGEENARNSVQWGDGVYKSTDGGDTFVHMGLRATFQIGHIAIHPQNPDIVWVAALGRLWGDNEERGVYKTKDGGQTWEKVLYLNASTGCIDVRLDPRNPDTVYAVMYHRRRPIFDDNDPSVRLSEHSGLWKSTDGGDNWQELTQGLPTCKWGRAGIDIQEQNPDVLLAIIETERSGWARGDRKDRAAGDPPDPDAQGRPGQGQGQGQGQGPRGATLGLGRDAEDGGDSNPGVIVVSLMEGGPAEKAGIKAGDRITKIDEEAVKSFMDLREIEADSAVDKKSKLTVVRGAETLVLEVTFGQRQFGGGNPLGGGNGPYGGRLFGQQQNKQKAQGELGFETGGVFRSDDRGATWTRVNSLTERPFYYSVIRVDPRNDKHVYCVGTTLWGSFDGGEKFEAINQGIHVDFHAFWVDPDDSNHLLAGCDGGVNETFDRGKTWQVLHGFSAAQFYDIAADNSVPYNVIGGLQDNGTWVGPSRTRAREGIGWFDWQTIWGGDGFGAQTDPVEPWIVYATSQNGAMGIYDTRTGNQARMQRARPPKGTAAFNWDAPFILSPHNRLVIWHAGNFVFRGDRYSHLDNRDNKTEQGPIRNADTVAMACVSPQLGLTDQGTASSIAESPRARGLVYVGTDDGALWRTSDNAVTWEQIHAKLPCAPRYVSDIVPSHFKDSRVYLTLDGHRFDDMRTYVFVSEDKGETWTSLGDDLPTYETCYAVMEDPRNENLLWLGTEFGCWVSLDRGKKWLPMGSGLPTVAVRDLFVQDRDSDLVIATHGRGAWVCDIEPLRQMTASVAKKNAHLFTPETAILWRLQSRGGQGHRDHHHANPPYGATIYLLLKNAQADGPTVTIHDVTGSEVAKVQAGKTAGLHALQWDGRLGQNRLAKPGSYSARVQIGEDKLIAAFTLRADPMVADTADPTTATQDRE